MSITAPVEPGKNPNHRKKHHHSATGS